MQRVLDSLAALSTDCHVEVEGEETREEKSTYCHENHSNIVKVLCLQHLCYISNTVKPGVSKLFLVNNLALVNIFCFPKSHFQHKSPIDSKQPGVSKLFAA